MLAVPFLSVLRVYLLSFIETVTYLSANVLFASSVSLTENVSDDCRWEAEVMVSEVRSFVSPLVATNPKNIIRKTHYIATAIHLTGYCLLFSDLPRYFPHFGQKSDSSSMISLQFLHLRDMILILVF